jgi:hypothetical protein
MDDEQKSLFERLQQTLRKLTGRRQDQGRDDSDEDGDVLVGAPLRPRPHLNSGAVALDLPDDEE